jgi:hypothetical protein
MELPHALQFWNRGMFWLGALQKMANLGFHYQMEKIMSCRKKLLHLRIKKFIK